MPAPIARVVLGGTFDHLHAGHKALLATALRVAGPVAIGLTTDAYLRAHPKSDGRAIRPYAVRRRALVRWLQKTAPRRPWRVVPLSDPFGRSILPGAAVLVASVETRRGAATVNRVRRRRGLPPLQIVLVPLVLGDDLEPITSTRIRAGIIDANGHRRSAVRVGLWSSSVRRADPIARAIRQVFPRVRVDSRLARSRSTDPALRQVRGWSRRALEGNELACAVFETAGRAPELLFSERSRSVELYPKRLRASPAPSVADWVRVLRPSPLGGRTPKG